MRTRFVSLALIVPLLSCARSHTRHPTWEEEDKSIRFPKSYGLTSIRVGKEGNVYDIDGVTLRAINVAADDFIRPDFEARYCWQKREAHRFSVIRQGDIIFVDVSLDLCYCDPALLPLDYGVSYAISTDGRILRRLFAGEPEDWSSLSTPDAGELGPEYYVDPSQVGATFGPVDHAFLEKLERMQCPRSSSRSDGGSSPPSSPDAGTPLTPPQVDGGTPPAP